MRRVKKTYKPTESYSQLDYFDKFLSVTPMALALWRCGEAYTLDRMVRSWQSPVLDLGCGFGEFMGVYFKSTIEMGIDINQKDLILATYQKKYQIIGLNGYSLQNVQTSGQHLRTITLKSPNTTLVYHFYPTEEDALIAFKLGHVDRIDNITAPYLEDWRGIVVSKAPYSNRYLTLFFNTTDSQLQDKSIRQLLAYATPKKTDDTRTISPISRTSWVYNPQVKPYIQNLDTAKAMLEKLTKADARFTLQLTITTTPAYVEMAQQIIQSWQQIGITTGLKIVPFPDTNDYQILLIGQQVPDDPDQYPLWHSTQPTNIAHYQSPKIDKLLEDGRKEMNREQRMEIYQDFQRFLVEDCPALFLHELPMYTISRSKINFN